MELPLSKFTTSAWRHGLPKRFVQLGRVGVTALGALGSLAASLIGFLAVGTGASDTSEESEIVPSGGVLNYRTGKLDDGTDPIGWYEKD